LVSEEASTTGTEELSVVISNIPEGTAVNQLVGFLDESQGIRITADAASIENGSLRVTAHSATDLNRLLSGDPIRFKKAQASKSKTKCFSKVTHTLLQQLSFQKPAAFKLALEPIDDAVTGEIIQRVLLNAENINVPLANISINRATKTASITFSQQKDYDHLLHANIQIRRIPVRARSEERDYSDVFFFFIADSH
jgi:hypothetical protein